MFKCAVTYLGCKVNQCEAEALKSNMRDLGYEIVDFSEWADIYVINTCCVTAEGERKSRQTVRRARAVNPDARVFVTGCAAQKSPEAFKGIDGVEIVCGNSLKHRLAELVSEKQNGIFVEDMKSFNKYYEMADSVGEKTRAFIKVQDGCNNFCSYCIIPYVRGRERSRSIESIVEECNVLRDKGYKEIVINGIHLSSYGKEWGYKLDLATVVERICEIDGIERVRIGSLEPNVITEDFIRRVTAHKEFCRHYHLSLQSGCDTVLKRMNRKYTCAEFFDAVSIIRNSYPLSAISTDIITGFPGESMDEFNTTLDFQDKAGFAWIHVFPYSVREGTAAAGMDGQIEKGEKARRAKILSERARVNGEKYRSQFIGKVKSVLCETNEGGIQTGLIKEHIAVSFISEPAENEIVNVKITKITDDGLFGERID